MDAVREIKSRINILDVISPVVKLKKTGQNYSGLCPFHGEKTPSFHVNPDRNAFYCFGCGVGGDIFTFVEKYENVDFVETMRILADRANVDLSQFKIEKKDKEKDERIYTIHEATNKFFTASLHEESGKNALGYLVARHIGEDVIREWGIGYAPDRFDALLNYLEKQDFTIKEMIEASLLSEKNAKPFDRFRNRITIPICDGQGRIVAFGARALSKEDEPKYLNSSSTPVYDKSSILFGFHKAKDAIRKDKFALLAEGYFDVISLHKVGIKNSVATCGTSITIGQLKILRRYTDELAFILDGDKAGIKGIARAVPLAKSLEFKVTCVILPENMDPDDFANNNPRGLNDAVAGRVDSFDFLLQTSVKFFGMITTQAKTDIFRSLAPILSGYSNGIEKEIEIKKVADLLGINPQTITEEIKKYSQQEIKTSRENSSVSEKKVNQKAYLLGYFDVFGEYLEDLKKELPNHGDVSETEIANQAIYISEMCRTWSEKNIKINGKSLLEKYKKDVLESRMKFFSEAIKQAEISGDEEKLGKLREEFQGLLMRD